MKTWKHFTIFVILAIFSIVVGFAACVKITKFEGTWTREDSRYQLIFSKNNFVVNISNGNSNKGTFTFTENELQLTVTHVFSNDQWIANHSISTFQYTFDGLNTLVLEQEERSVGGIFIGAYKKTSE